MFYHIFPCRSVFLLELTLSSVERERVCVWEKEKGYTYLPFLFGAFLFFLLWIAFLSSLSFSPPPPPPPPPLFFFREGETLLSTSRLELLSSAYLAIILFSSSSHHYHHHSSWVSWKRLCKSHIPLLFPFPSRPLPCLASTI